MLCIVGSVLLQFDASRLGRLRNEGPQTVSPLPTSPATITATTELSGWPALLATGSFAPAGGDLGVPSSSVQADPPDEPFFLRPAAIGVRVCCPRVVLCCRAEDVRQLLESYYGQILPI